MLTFLSAFQRNSAQKMPYKFKFESNDGTVNFSCPLECNQCEGINRNGNQCSRRTCIGTPFCWTHLWSMRNLRILPSNIPNAGKGLFAVMRRGADMPPGNIIFTTGATIIDYYGESMPRPVLDARYGDFTAPYGVGWRAMVEDGACRRGVGSLANGGTPHARAVIRRSNARYSRLQDGRYVLKATKSIKHGQEIICYYGEEYRLNEPVVSGTRYVR